MATVAPQGPNANVAVNNSSASVPNSPMAGNFAHIHQLFQDRLAQSVADVNNKLQGWHTSITRVATALNANEATREIGARLQQLISAPQTASTELSECRNRFRHLKLEAANACGALSDEAINGLEDSEFKSLLRQQKVFNDAVRNNKNLMITLNRLLGDGEIDVALNLIKDLPNKNALICSMLTSLIGNASNSQEGALSVEIEKLKRTLTRLSLTAEDLNEQYPAFQAAMENVVTIIEQINELIKNFTPDHASHRSVTTIVSRFETQFDYLLVTTLCSKNQKMDELRDALRGEAAGSARADTLQTIRQAAREQMQFILDRLLPTARFLGLAPHSLTRNLETIISRYTFYGYFEKALDLANEIHASLDHHRVFIPILRGAIEQNELPRFMAYVRTEPFRANFEVIFKNLISENRFEEAVQLAQMISDVTIKDRLLTEIIKDHVQNEQIDQARVLFATLTDQTCKNKSLEAFIFYYRRRSSRNLAQAEIEASQLIVCSPDKWEGRCFVKIAEAYLEARDIEKAKVYITGKTLNDDDSCDIWAKLAKAYIRLGNLNAAADAVRQMPVDNPSTSLQIGKSELLLEIVNTLLDRPTPDLTLAIQLAHAMGRPVQKEEAYTKILRHYFQRGDLSAAKAFVETLSGTHRQKCSVSLIEANVQRRNIDEALAILNTLGAEFPRRNHLLGFIIRKLVEDKAQIPRALKTLAETVGERDRNAAYDVIFEAYLERCDDPAGALTIIHRLTNQEFAYVQLADYYLVRNQPSDAERYLEQANNEHHALSCWKKVAIFYAQQNDIINAHRVFFKIISEDSRFFSFEGSDFITESNVELHWEAVRGLPAGRRKDFLLTQIALVFLSKRKPLEAIQAANSLGDVKEEFYDEESQFMAILSRSIYGMLRDNKSQEAVELIKLVPQAPARALLNLVRDNVARVGPVIDPHVEEGIRLLSLAVPQTPVSAPVNAPENRQPPLPPGIEIEDVTDEDYGKDGRPRTPPKPVEPTPPRVDPVVPPRPPSPKRKEDRTPPPAPTPTPVPDAAPSGGGEPTPLSPPQPPPPLNVETPRPNAFVRPVNRETGRPSPVAPKVHFGTKLLVGLRECIRSIVLFVTNIFKIIKTSFNRMVALINPSRVQR